MGRIGTDLVRRLPMEAGLSEEVEQGHHHLPSRVAEDAVRPHIDEYAAQVAAQCGNGPLTVSADIVWMPKAPLKYRPLAAFPLAGRAVFRSLATAVRETLDDDFSVPVDTQDSFARELVDDERAFTHFVRADVTAFYRYVPHRVLHRRILEETGRLELADAVKAFLTDALGGDVGLPQGVGGSDLFAELVISSVERRLAKQGIAIARFRDDFCIAGTSLDVVRSGIEELQRELHAIGLTLNEAKTWVLPRDYFIRLSREMERFGVLDGAPPADALTAVHDAQALGLLRTAVARGFLRHARAAVRRLMLCRDPSALDQGEKFINRYPRLTQVYCRYCSELVAAGHRDDVANYLHGVFPRLVLTEWQETWLLYLLGSGVEPRAGPLREWLTARLDPDTPSILRAQAALVAARFGLLPPRRARAIVEAVSEVARPDAILALSLVNDRRSSVEKLLTRLPDSLLARWIYRSESAVAAQQRPA